MKAEPPAVRSMTAGARTAGPAFHSMPAAERPPEAGEEALDIPAVAEATKFPVEACL